jgi:hypothetical protein
MIKLTRVLLVATAVGGFGVCHAALAQDAGTGEMGFFVTSTGLGDGANLGGLEGADAHCQSLAEAAGAGDRTWAAYLSTQGEGAENARERIGTGPWHNANGELIAENVDALHAEDVNIYVETALNENGESVPFVAVDEAGNPVQPADNPNPVEHDILTGTQIDGTAFAAGEDMTCSNWTSNGEGSAMLGHHDRRSLQPGISPWNAAHPSRGCSQENLVQTGGAGRFYCFATN